MRKIRKYAAIGIALGLGASLAGCGNTTQEVKSTSETVSPQSQSVTDTENKQDTDGEVKVAFISNYPTSYLDDDDNPTGYDIEVLKKVDEGLPEYDFTYEYVSYDAAYTGLATGVYDIVVSDAFYTDERAEKYNLTENPLGAELVSLIVRNENKDITTLEQAAKAGLTFTPVRAGSGIVFVYQDYNENADTPIDIDTSGDNSAEAFQWVAEGRYDAFLGPKSQFDADVVAEDGAYHNLEDQLSASIYTSVYTYPVIAKDQTELAEAVSEQLGTLYDNGTLKQVAEKFFGYNTFAYKDGKLLDGETAVE